MMWQEDDILITVRAYPNPSRKHRETSCVAGIRLQDHSWVRLHPIPYRLLPDEQRFRKYDVIRAQVRRSSDIRPESYQINLDASIERIDHINPKNKWRERNDLILPLRSSCVEELQAKEVGQQSLGLVRVRELQRLEIVPQDEGWTSEKQQFLQTRRFFDREIVTLECPAFKFYYRYICENPSCRSHRMQIVDWEVIQSYRTWRRKYGPEWEEKFRQKYEGEMATKDFHLFLGTMLKWPQQWIIVGVYYPPAA